MSATGMFEAGAVGVRVGAIYDGEGFRRWERDVEHAERTARERRIEAALGADFNPAAFERYERALRESRDLASRRRAFKAELGGDYNARAFNAYERALKEAKAESARAVKVDLGADFDRSRFDRYRHTVRDVNRAHDDLVRGTGRVKGAFGSLFIGGAGVAAGAIGFGALAAGAKSATDAFYESDQVARQTDAVLRSTGAQAWITADAVSNLAGRISDRTGIDDEAVQSAENLLLTFKQVQNRAGEGNDVFDHATATIADLSVAMGTDMRSASLQVGRALNDPIRGVAALGRVGITFTDEQKRTIRALVERGRTLDAQKIILRELDSQFAGSAEKTATNSRRMQVALGNLQEEIGGKLAPVVEDVAGEVTEFTKGLTDGTGAGGRFLDRVKSIGGAVEDGLGKAVKWVTGVFRENEETIDDTADALGDVVEVAEDIGGSVLRDIRRTFGREGGGRDVREFISGLFGVIKIGAQIVAWFAQRLAPGIKTALGGIVQTVRGIVRVVGGILHGDFGKVWDGVKDIFAGNLKRLVGTVTAITAPFRYAFSRLGSAIVNTLDGPLSFVRRLVRLTLDKFLGLISGVMGGLADMADAASRLPIIGKKFEGLADKIRGAKGDIDRFRESLREQDKQARRTEGIERQRRHVEELRDKLATLNRGSRAYRATLEDLRRAQRRLNDTLGDTRGQRRASRAFLQLVANVWGFGVTAADVMEKTGGNVNDVLSSFGARALKFAVERPRAAVRAAATAVGVVSDLLGYESGGIVGGAGARGARGHDDQLLAVEAGGSFANAHQLPLIEAALAMHGLTLNDVWRSSNGGGGSASELVLAARGEAYFTPNETTAVDRMLRGAYGAGLDALFSSTSHTRHAFAAGGRVGRQTVTVSEYGNGDGDAMGASLFGWAELSNPPGSLNFSALGNLPRGYKIAVNYNGKRVVGPKVDVGGGGPGLGGKVRAVDLTQAMARALGFSGLANMLITDAEDDFSGAGDSIQPLKIKGPAGVLRNALQAISNKAARSGNAYIESRRPQTVNGNFGATLPAGAPASLSAAMSLARAMGLSITSTTGGTHTSGSYHYLGRAFDASNGSSPTPQMAAFYNAVKARWGRNITELFYDPLGGIKHGAEIGAIGGHSDHVHVAFQRGGRVLGALARFAGGGRVRRGSNSRADAAASNAAYRTAVSEAVSNATAGTGRRLAGLRSIGRIEGRIDNLQQRLPRMQRRFDLSDEVWIIEGDEDTPPAFNDRALRRRIDEQKALLAVRVEILRRTRRLLRLVRATLALYRKAQARVERAIDVVRGRLRALTGRRGRQASWSRRVATGQLGALKDALGPINERISPLAEKAASLPWDIEDADLDVREQRKEIKALDPLAQIKDYADVLHDWRAANEPDAGASADDAGGGLGDAGGDDSASGGSEVGGDSGSGSSTPSPEEFAQAVADGLAALNANRGDLFSNYGSTMESRSAAGGLFGDPSRAAAGPRYFGAFGKFAEAAGGPSYTFVNNFAAPPPDAHTWTDQQRFAVEGSIS